MRTINHDFFGSYGGRYVAEILRPALDQLEREWRSAMNDPAFRDELDTLLREFAGRPTPFTFAENATRALGGARIFIKLEGFAHTGAHKINNALGQALLARRLGKSKVIAETGAGQHGVAAAAACARLGLQCRVYMGETDVRRQRPNVFWMELYGAEVVPVKRGGPHGSEDPEQCFRAAFPYYKAVRIGDERDVDAAGAFRCPRVLADASVPGLPGGTGRSIPDSLVRRMGERGPLWLAGGIGPANVRGLIHAFGPELVDCSSTLEASPGKKDPQMLKRFFEEVARANDQP